MTNRLLPAIVLIVSLAACGHAADRANEGTIVDREFEPPANGSGIGTGVCSGVNGSGACTGTVFWSRGEAWYLIIEAPDGQVWAEKVTPEVWARYEEGDHWERPSDD